MFFSTLGTQDPHHNELGLLNFLLKQVTVGWKCKDSTPMRQHPVPQLVLKEATRLSHKYNCCQELAITNLMWLGFFYLLHPGENFYMTKGRYTHFGQSEFTGAMTPLQLLDQVTYAGLYFTMQKNRISGKTIGGSHPLVN